MTLTWSMGNVRARIGCIEMSRRRKKLRGRGNETHQRPGRRRQTESGYYVLGLWLVTLMLLALIGVPMWRVLREGRHAHVSLALVLLATYLTGASVVAAYRWLRSRFRLQSKR